MTDNFQRPYSQDHIIKQWVDECTGKFIDPITVTDAVITKHGKTLTEVLDLIFGSLRQNKDLLNNLKIRIEDLERYKEQFIILKQEFDSLKYQINTGVFAKQSDLECLRSTLEALRQQLNSNNALFTQLLAYLMGQGGQSSQDPIDIADLAGYLRTADLLSAIDNLNVFTKNIKSDLTGNTYSPNNGLTTLPPTVGGALYVGDTAHSGLRFYYTLNGDVNGDGYVTAADITALYNWLLYNDASQLVNPDVFPDGNITAADITKVYDVLLDGRVATVHDRITNKDYTLPEGTIFANGKYIYRVLGDGSSNLIGELQNQNADYYTQNAPNTTYNTFNGPGHQNSEESNPEDDPQESIPEIDPEVSEELAEDMNFIYDTDKVINSILVGSMIKENDETTIQKITEIKEAIQGGTFDISTTNFSDIAVNLNWKGLPQSYAQGLVFLKDGNTQYVEPLGSFLDFKRSTDNVRTNYIDIVLCKNNNTFDVTPTRFEVKSLTTAMQSASDEAVFGTIYAENEENDLVFCWIGTNPNFKGKPVVIPSRDFTSYYNSVISTPSGN